MYGWSFWSLRLSESPPKVAQNYLDTASHGRTKVSWRLPGGLVEADRF